MNFLSSASSRALLNRRFRVHICRHNSTDGGTAADVPETVHLSFKRLGVPASVAATLRAAFPDIQSPTKTQSQLIPAILGGKDVLLKDRTGTGKSFGLILALLSDFRVWRSAHESHNVPGDPSISSLVIVPHRDLAYQLSHWIQLFADAKIQAQRPSLPSIVQVLVRSSAIPLETQLEGLRNVTPQILIGTPQVLLDNYDRLKLHKLNCVVIDEVDSLIETVPNLPDKYKMEKLRRKIEKHPGPTRELLDLVLAPRTVAPEGGRHSSQKPQLILSSATLRSHLNRFLFQRSGWLTRGEQHLVKIKGDQNFTVPVHGASNVYHSTLVVTQDGEIRNIEGSVALNSKEPSQTQGSEDLDTTRVGSGLELYEQGMDLNEFTEGVPTPPPWNPAALETISMCFALDVPRVALLVVPSSAPVQRVVRELRSLEVNARGLDLLVPEAGKRYLLQGNNPDPEECPTLLVSTLASIRGLDLPELSHVFILGIPQGRIDSYLHISGRTGRFGKPGRVITVVEREEEQTGEGVKVIKDEERMMKSMFGKMGITPIKIEHFD